MKYFLIISALFILGLSGNAQTTEQLSQVIGFLEVHPSSDSTSIYLGKYAGQKIDLDKIMNNIMIGYNAGEKNQRGANNVFIGSESGQNNRFGGSNVFIGNDSGESEKGSGNTFVGSSAGEETDSTEFNSFFGYNAGDEVEGNYNVFLGAKAGNDATTGDYNTVVGYRAGEKNDTDKSTFIGAYAGLKNRGGDNYFAGYRSGENNTFGRNNSFGGSEAGRSNVTGNFNSFYGALAGTSSEAMEQTFIGASAGISSISGGGSVVLGALAATGDIAITNSVYIGHRAGNISGGTTERTGNIFIGYYAGANQRVDNKLFISNSNAGKEDALIYGEFDNDILRVNGDLHLAANAANGNTILRMEGVGGQMNEVIRYDGDTNDVIMGSVSGGGGKLLFRADGAPAMTILENGNVGIGNTNPPDKFHVVGNGYFSNFVIAEEEVFINGMVAGPGTSDVRYNATTGRLTQSTSDRRLKENIKTIDSALDKITKLRGVSFTWKEETDGQPQLGLIAQEVKEVLPEVVSQNKNGYYGVDYTETIGVFVEAIKEQQEMIIAQQNQITQLIKELSTTNSEVAQLKISTKEESKETEE